MLTMRGFAGAAGVAGKRAPHRMGRSTGFIARRQGAGIVQSFLDRIAIGPLPAHRDFPARQELSARAGMTSSQCFGARQPMPMIRANGTALYYEDTGDSGAPVVFSHGLLWNSSLFAPQIAVLKD